MKKSIVAAGAFLALPAARGQEGEAPAQLSIARWKPTGPEPAADVLREVAVKLTEQSIAGVGGMGRFVAKGDVVWLKPNIGFLRGPESGANTNPDVVATLVRLCLDAGAKRVRVGDHSCYGAEGAYPASGIEAAVQAVGGEVVYLAPKRFKMMAVNGERIRKWPVSADIIETDLVINVPVAKSHGLTAVSLCFKNYMGIIGGPRNEWHADMPTCLTDMTAFMKPRLTVLDAVRVLTKNGPIGLRPSDTEVLGTVAVSTDVVGLEAFGAELLGCDPGQGKTMAKAQERGLGTIDYRRLVCRESELA